MYFDSQFSAFALIVLIPFCKTPKLCPIMILTAFFTLLLSTMPRSSRGRRGSFSSASSHPDITKNVATAKGLSSVSNIIQNLTGSPRSCRVVFDVYEECVKKLVPRYGESACDFHRKMKETCSSRFKIEPDPRRESLFVSIKKWEESMQRTATAKGFASINDYLRHKYERDVGMCRIAFRLYNECLLRNPADKTLCDYLRNNCPQFKS